MHALLWSILFVRFGTELTRSLILVLGLIRYSVFLLFHFNGFVLDLVPLKWTLVRTFRHGVTPLSPDLFGLPGQASSIQTNGLKPGCNIDNNLLRICLQLSYPD